MGDDLEGSVQSSTTGLTLTNRFGKRKAPKKGSEPPFLVGPLVVTMRKEAEDGRAVQLGVPEDPDLIQHPVLGTVNKLAVIKATKDAEICRLRDQVQAAAKQLKRLEGWGGGRNHGRGPGPSKVHSRLGDSRIDGGRRGGYAAVGGVLRIPRNPRMNSSSVASSMRWNSGTGSKLRAELDAELDLYMSQSKARQKAELDKQLEQYVKSKSAGQLNPESLEALDQDMKDPSQSQSSSWNAGKKMVTGPQEDDELDLLESELEMYMKEARAAKAQASAPVTDLAGVGVMEVDEDI